MWRQSSTEERPLAATPCDYLVGVNNTGSKNEFSYLCGSEEGANAMAASSSPQPSGAAVCGDKHRQDGYRRQGADRASRGGRRRLWIGAPPGGLPCEPRGAPPLLDRRGLAATRRGMTSRGIPLPPSPPEWGGEKSGKMRSLAACLRIFFFLRPCLVPKKICKIFQIPRHIESLDACMKY